MPTQFGTARVIWSYHSQDPSSSDPSQPFTRHEHQGSVSLNLLGGPRSIFQEPETITSFNITNINVSKYDCIAYVGSEAITALATYSIMLLALCALIHRYTRTQLLLTRREMLFQEENNIMTDLDFVFYRFECMVCVSLRVNKQCSKE